MPYLSANLVLIIACFSAGCISTWRVLSWKFDSEIAETKAALAVANEGIRMQNKAITEAAQAAKRLSRLREAALADAKKRNDDLRKRANIPHPSPADGCKEVLDKAWSRGM